MSDSAPAKASKATAARRQRKKKAAAAAAASAASSAASGAEAPAAAAKPVVAVSDTTKKAAAAPATSDSKVAPAANANKSALLSAAPAPATQQTTATAADTKSAANPQASKPLPKGKATASAASGGSVDAKGEWKFVPPLVLSAEQIAHFKAHGWLVVNGILPAAELKAVRDEYHATLKQHFGVDHDDLEHTAKGLKAIHVAGGIVEVFHAPFKLRVLQNERMYGVVSQLYAATFASGTESGFEQPHGAFDPQKLLMYIDRTNYRVPTKLALALGHGKHPLQSGLKPHVDSNPYALYDLTVTDGKSKSRWRPIQSFITLTEVKGANHGGLELVDGFHKEYDAFFAAQSSDKVPRQPPHKEHFQLHPEVHPQISARLKKDIRIEAGGAVFWDWRVVHCNAAGNESKGTREVVYTGFLPDVALNRKYVADQLLRYRSGGGLPYDFRVDSTPATVDRDPTWQHDFQFSELGARMIGLNEWSGQPIPQPPTVALESAAAKYAAANSKSAEQYGNRKQSANTKGGGSGSGGGAVASATTASGGGKGGGKSGKGKRS